MIQVEDIIYRGQNDQNNGLSKDSKSKKVIQKVAPIEGDIYVVSSTFPFDLFPNKLVIDFNRVSLVRKQFFLSQTLHSVFIKDITDVIVNTAPVFATIEIIDKNFKENQIQIKYVKRHEAIKARDIIEGLLIVNKQNVDISKFKKKQDVLELLVNIGETKGTSLSQ